MVASTLLIDEVPRVWESDKDRDPSGVAAFGAGLASGELFQRLLEDGNARRIIVLYSSSRMERVYQERLAAFKNRERVTLLSVDDAEQLLQEPSLILFSLSSRIADLAHIRAWSGQARWVVAGITHAISHSNALVHALYTLLHQLYQHDILASTSSAALQAVQNLLKHAGESLEPRIGRTLTTNISLPIIPLGVDEEFYVPGNRAEARKKMGLEARRQIFLCIGRLSPITKLDPHPLILAFKEAFHSRQDRPLLLLAGDDTEQRAAEGLRAYAAELGLAGDVLVRPDVTKSEKLSLYQSADVVVSPSDNLQETFGCTLLEAMSCGLPVIASDWSGYRDIVSNGKAGFLIPTVWADCWGHPGVTAPFTADRDRHGMIAQTVAFDFRVMVDRLRRLTESEHLRDRMGMFARRRVLDGFTWRSVVRRHEEAWRLSLSAKQDSVLDRRVAGLSAYNPVDIFKHYPSRILNQEDFVSISPAGRRCLDGEALPFYRPEDGDAIRILVALASAGRSTVADLLKEDAGHRPRREREFRLLLRMIKYGLVELTAGKGEA
jgi:glycosyltransferase involved in cell wall biosynthesis